MTSECQDSSSRWQSWLQEKCRIAQDRAILS